MQKNGLKNGDTIISSDRGLQHRIIQVKMCSKQMETEMTNTGIIIQARMSSSRLPNKVLKPINNRPMLSYMLERVKSAENIKEVVLATSEETSDDAIERACETENVDCYRGNLDDVLDRYYQAASAYQLETVVRLTADCPLVDPLIIDEMVALYNENDYDYMANTLQPNATYPEGMDVEIFSFNLLEEAWKVTRKPSEREHVTFHFWQNPDKFSIYRHHLSTDASHFRLTVDYPEDFEVVKAIILDLYSSNPLFSLSDVINYLDAHPDIASKNANITPNQGWKSAFDRDKRKGF